MSKSQHYPVRPAGVKAEVVRHAQSPTAPTSINL